MLLGGDITAKKTNAIVIRIAAITLASDSAITLVQFRPSKGRFDLQKKDLVHLAHRLHTVPRGTAGDYADRQPEAIDQHHADSVRPFCAPPEDVPCSSPEYRLGWGCVMQMLALRFCRSTPIASSIEGSRVPCHFGLSILGSTKKTINIKHINIFLAALAGQSSRGRTPTRFRDKRDKMASLLWN